MPKKFEEIEGKFLDINPPEIANKLKGIGAKHQFKKLFRRNVFDFPDRRLNAQASWLRLRDEGDKVTLTFKQRTDVQAGRQDSGMREIEVLVDDFDQTAELLRAIGMEVKFYEENWRTLYKLGDVEICIDEWPLIPPYLEIEADSWQKVDKTAVKLGLNPADKQICATMQVYKKYGINENDYILLTFDKQEKVSK